jgi:hypothetical protein
VIEWLRLALSTGRALPPLGDRFLHRGVAERVLSSVDWDRQRIPQRRRGSGVHKSKGADVGEMLTLPFAFLLVAAKKERFKVSACRKEDVAGQQGVSEPQCSGFGAG